MSRFSFILLVLLPFMVCSQKFLNKLESKAVFDKFSGLPLSEKYGQVSSIKLVYELRTKKLYFINSGYFKYHYNFCSHELDNSLELEYFNRVNYSDDPQREYLLANINYFKALNIYALEISPSDFMSKEAVIMLRNSVSDLSFIGDSLYILLNTPRLRELKQESKDNIPLIEPSEIYGKLEYQAISKYKNCGIVHFINNSKANKNSIKPTDILIINETPLFLPKVAGIIVTEFQTPLSHLTILGQNRKIPIAAYKSAFTDSALIRLNDKKVCLTVTGDTFKIEQSEYLNASNQIQKTIKLNYSLKEDSLTGIEYLNKKSYKYAGNKAANLGILYQLSKKYDFNVPENAFVIPFYFYHRHIINSKANLLIDSLLNQKENSSSDAIERLLKAIRKEINQAPLDSNLLRAVSLKTAGSNYTSFRFRSSTNAEDADGFSGAGLYTSKTGIMNDEKKSFEKAIKKVWASLWSYEAYSERELFNINHRDVYMGILVHRSFPDEAVNGVLITKNLYRRDSYGFVVNAQIGDESVVKPKQGNVSDQFVCYPDNTDNLYDKKSVIDIITQSNLNNNNLVMSTAEIQKLANISDKIKRYFINHTFTAKTYFDFGLDLEFKLDGADRKLYIKQVRLYND